MCSTVLLQQEQQEDKVEVHPHRGPHMLLQGTGGPHKVLLHSWGPPEPQYRQGGVPVHHRGTWGPPQMLHDQGGPQGPLGGPPGGPPAAYSPDMQGLAEGCRLSKQP